MVTVNYRLGETEPSPSPSPSSGSLPPRQNGDLHARPFYKYPIPVHDTLAGFDWIQQTLQPAQLGVFGTHIGGALALMLALTEAQNVRAVAALEPVCDWVGLDEYCTVSLVGKDGGGGGNAQTEQVSRRKKKPAPADLVPLLEARERFFQVPERYFDAFASPVLFLRAAGRDVPGVFPRYLTGPQYPVPVLEVPDIPEQREEHAALWDIYMQDELLGNDYLDAEETADRERGGFSSNPAGHRDDGKVVVRRRKALSRWPPYGLDYGASGAGSSSRLGIGRLQITLPWVRIYARNDAAAHGRQMSVSGSGSKSETVLARQADEMVSVMRRACFWARERGYGVERVQLIPVDSDVSSTAVEDSAGEWLQNLLVQEEEVDDHRN